MLRPACLAAHAWVPTLQSVKLAPESAAAPAPKPSSESPELQQSSTPASKKFKGAVIAGIAIGSCVLLGFTSLAIFLVSAVNNHRMYRCLCGLGGLWQTALSISRVHSGHTLANATVVYLARYPQADGLCTCWLQWHAVSKGLRSLTLHAGAEGSKTSQ